VENTFSPAKGAGQDPLVRQREPQAWGGATAMGELEMNGNFDCRGFEDTKADFPLFSMREQE
jgi:hypothetical protein